MDDMVTKNFKKVGSDILVVGKTSGHLHQSEFFREVAGIKDILTKVRRSSNPVNAAKAALQGLQLLKNREIEMEQRRLLITNSKDQA